MRRLPGLIVLTLIPTLFGSGCASRLNHPMKCENILALRIGQTKDQVRALLGDPVFEVDQRGIFSDGAPREDHVWFYGTADTGWGRWPVGTREEMSVSFLQGLLVEANAYRMFDRVIDSKEQEFGFHIRKREIMETDPSRHTTSSAKDFL